VARRRKTGVPTWVWFAGAAAVAFWLLTRESSAAAETPSIETDWWNYDEFMSTPPYTPPENLPEPGVSGGSH
jgi:hypothetical protein